MLYVSQQYTDQRATRHLKTFDRKKDADAWACATKVEVIKGIHTPASASITVADAAQRWLDRCQRDGLEPATLRGYRTNVRYHIAEMLGGARLATLTVPSVRP